MIRYLKEDVNYNSFIIINIKDSTWWNRFTYNERNYLSLKLSRKTVLFHLVDGQMVKNFIKLIKSKYSKLGHLSFCFNLTFEKY